MQESHGREVYIRAPTHTYRFCAASGGSPRCPSCRVRARAPDVTSQRRPGTSSTVGTSSRILGAPLGAPFRSQTSPCCFSPVCSTCASSCGPCAVPPIFGKVNCLVQNSTSCKPFVCLADENRPASDILQIRLVLVGLKLLWISSQLVLD